MNTDFAEMGLDTDGSYIVVISGDEPASQSNSNSRSGDKIDQQIGGLEGAGSSYFYYTYKGNSYLMRYVTVTSTDDARLRVSSIYVPQDQDLLEHFVNKLFTTVLLAGADSIKERVPFGTIASLFMDIPEDNIYLELDPNSLAIHAATAWYCNYIQVWNEYDQTWDSSQCSDYAISMAYCAGTMYDASGTPIPNVGDPVYITIYSDLYYESEERKLDAMQAYDKYTIYTDYLEYVDFYAGDENGEIVYAANGERLFRHNRVTSLILPDAN